MKKVNKHTRANSHGKSIVCPECKHTGTVYHFSWGALGCNNCEKMIDKHDWLLEEESRERQKDLEKHRMYTDPDENWSGLR